MSSTAAEVVVRAGVVVLVLAVVVVEVVVVELVDPCDTLFRVGSL